MRWIGLDYGDKTIGVAMSDELGWTAQALEVIHRRKPGEDIDRLVAIVEQYGVTQIVVGLPKNMNNTIGPRGELAIEFSKELEQKLSVPVHLWDERLTTVAATRTLLEADVSRKKRKQVIDKMAAQIILQGYMDANMKR
ncbi:MULTISPECIES: Holliday junction resolvase RuvX [Paenibacillus]|uniref:Putative pre-16S rRNA nuclease n=3 Tax=Paenibacillus TaxID=44249 RepID=A0ABU3RGR6_9BACL|nr:MULTISPECIES: Holliday junction resolvase RuvX [Paenibacillus]MBA2939238.1 Holliday junction resolvase RuvX [Paenibacillus sp. CGMCC 1.16610]MCY9661106.1 Holliday junction resolvase RuvX [Paenibacillus anseongense]MDU0203437.1 Holliday junction resolvase RuvX [Paenibacillus sp. PFR10]MEB4794773.1 Holliday junction resolvase RuvX [Paenibacillus chondroitinus]MEC0266931.1 Holliday junction resolvase RuvX [Paenibacillus anseongense]